MPVDHQAIAMQEFLRRSTEEALKEECSKVGFMLAFLDATDLQPQDAEMVVSEMERVDPVTKERTLVRKLWFQRRQA